MWYCSTDRLSIHLRSSSYGRKKRKKGQPLSATRTFLHQTLYTMPPRHEIIQVVSERLLNDSRRVDDAHQGYWLILRRFLRRNQERALPDPARLTVITDTRDATTRVYPVLTLVSLRALFKEETTN